MIHYLSGTFVSINTKDAPLTVTFSDSSRSNPIKEPLVKWEWDYGDGVKETATTKGPQVHIRIPTQVYILCNQLLQIKPVVKIHPTR